MSEATRYLDGFLAATRPGVDRIGAKSLPPPIQPDCVPRPMSPAPPSEPEESSEDKIKRRLHPLDSFPCLLECVEANRPPTADDQFRFQWFGLLYQAPHQDAFLLRLRLPGGRVEAFQLARLAEITQSYAAGQVLLNAQGGLDIPGVPLPMAIEILRAVEGIGLSARQTGGDCVHSVRTDEHDGWTDARTGLVHPLVLGLEQALAHSRRLADLPRGCEIVFLSADQPLASDWSESADAILLKKTASGHPAASSGFDPGCEACFLLVVAGEATGGWRLAAAQVVSGCLNLLEDWATNADRTRRQNSGLAAYCRSLPHERIGLLLGKAEWQPLPPLSGASPASSSVAAPLGLPVPRGRLLSVQMRRIAEILRHRERSGVWLIRGALHLAPEANSEVREAVRLALNAW